MKKSPFTKIIVIMIVALLAPLLSYSIYQWTQFSDDEKMIATIYERQLNSILFSVNQHCWDVFNSWTIKLSSVLVANRDNNSHGMIDSSLNRFMMENPMIHGLYVKHIFPNDLLNWKTQQHERNSTLSKEKDIEQIDYLLTQNKSEIDKILEYADAGYIKPFIHRWTHIDNMDLTLLLFPLNFKTEHDSLTIIAGIFIDDIGFVNEIIGRKFRAIDNENFDFAVKRIGSDHIIYATTQSQEFNFEKQEQLWILPELTLLVKLKGKTLSEISAVRTRRSLLFLIAVNGVLILGVIYLIRNIAKELALVRMKTDFVANVSHELRTPLALIRLHAETLEMGRVRSEEKKHHYYKSIMNESVRLTQLINNILDFSKIESRKKEYHLQPADIAAVVNELLDMYSFHLDQKKFTLVKHVERPLPYIAADKDAVNLAIVNLLDNAVKFSGDQKRIEVIVKKNASRIELSIKDFGIGIPESEHKRIFEKFYRVENSLVHNTSGSGLGLSLVKHIMDIHHGNITVESEPNSGSTFTLIFPISQLNYQI